MLDFYNFEMTLSSKISLFRIIFNNFDILRLHFSEAGLTFDEYTSFCPEAFVHANVRLVHLIVNDKTSFHASLNISKSQFEALATAIDLFVRNSVIQSDLYRNLFNSVKDAKNHNQILKIIPKFFNMSRCLLDANSFGALVNASTNADILLFSITELIENTLSSSPTFNQAIDINVSAGKRESVSSRFKLAKDLLWHYELLERFVILIFEKMVQHADLIDIRGEIVFGFLNEALMPRRGASNISGSARSGPVNPEVIQLVVNFILLRNDVIGCALDYGIFLK